MIEKVQTMKIWTIKASDFVEGKTSRFMKELEQARKNMRKAKDHIKNAIVLAKSDPKTLEKLKEYFEEEVKRYEQ